MNKQIYSSLRLGMYYNITRDYFHFIFNIINENC